LKTKGKESARFEQVLKLLDAAESVPGYGNLVHKPGIRKAIVEACRDGQRRSGRCARRCCSARPHEFRNRRALPGQYEKARGGASILSLRGEREGRPGRHRDGVVPDQRRRGAVRRRFLTPSPIGDKPLPPPARPGRRCDRQAREVRL
jgi:hypothetical protein